MRDAQPAPRDADRFGLAPLALLLSCLAPLVALPWTVTYWPGNDDPNHLAVVHVLRHHADPALPFSRFFVTNLRVQPYSVYYGLLLGLARWMPLWTANRLVASCVVAALPLTVLFLLRRIAPARSGNVFLVASFVAGWPLMMGFQSFLLALICGLLAVGIAWGRPGGRGVDPGSPSSAAIGVASALMLLCALAHPVVPVLIGFVLLALDATRLRRLRTWLELAAITVPAGLLLIFCRWRGLALAPAGEPTSLSAVTFPRLNRIVLWLLKGHAIGLSSDEFYLRGVGTLLLLGYSIKAALQYGVRRAGRERDLARAFVALLAIYCLSPLELFGWGLCGEHVSILLFLWCALSAELPARLMRSRAVGIVVLLATLGLATVQYRAAAGWSSEIGELVEAGRAAPRGSTLLPIIFMPDARNLPTTPMLHSWGHLVLERDVVTPYLFAAGKSDMGGEFFRSLFYRDAFGDAFLPHLNEFAPLELGRACRDDLACRAERGTKLCLLRTIAHAYDRVLLWSPPGDVLEYLQQELRVERHVGGAWLLRTDAAAPGTRDAKRCEARWTAD